jgi:hypothetical protein
MECGGLLCAAQILAGFCSLEGAQYCLSFPFCTAKTLGDVSYGWERDERSGIMRFW